MSFKRLRGSGFSYIELLIFLTTLSLLIILGFYIKNKEHISQNVKNNSSTSSTLTKNSIIPNAKRYWIMSTTALNELISYPSVRNDLSNDTIFVPTKKSEQLSSTTNGLHIVPVESFTSEPQLANAINSKSINSSIKVLLYDNEDWPLTPVNEQQNLLTYYQKAASLAHKNGYLLIGTPVSKLDPQADVQIAPYVDVLDIQSQYDQSSSITYAGHVLPIAKTARKANPNLIILSGLSTNPPSGIPTARQLVNDAQAVSSIVQGYWLNIPSPGVACPRCNLPQPQIGVQFLRILGAN